MDTNIDKKPTSAEIGVATEVLKLVSDPSRLKILWALLHGEHSVGELAKHVDIQQSAVSQHLGKLRLAQLVRARREGNKIYYSTDNIYVHELIVQALSHAGYIMKGGLK